MNIQAYLDTLRAKYATGVATEHSYRPALEALLTAVGDGVEAVNEPRRVACGAPDFVMTRRGIDIGHCEAKDLHIDLAKLKDANLDQKKRYLKALPNLIYTNGIDFEFYKSGERVRAVSIGALTGGKIESIIGNFAVLEHQLRAFAAERPQSITSAKKLAGMMAGKAILIKDIMGNALRIDAHLQTELTGQFAAFKAHLIHDIDADEFADVYAETIAYGLFAARLHDTSLDSFDRSEALELLPKSNPFLRSLFGYIAGVDLDDRIAWVIDELCDVLRACDVHELMADFGRWTARNDPFLHFYETFLAEYNPAKRKARGVWYTPEPVVNFIVRAVDDVLKTEFGLADGLADTSKITIDWDTGQTDTKGKRVSIKKDVHRVQILDPATGTGTFLAEAIKQIAAKVKGVAPGMWSSYVERDLIPRIHGFELLMASYAMCHMKIDMMLSDLGYVPSGSPPRLSVYLTNSLEEGAAADQQLPFARWLSEEAKGANTIKRDTPIMCVIGNPPYSGISQNMGAWIVDKIEDYKYVDGEHFGERKHWLQDDYVKFIRLAEHMIDRNGEGVLGFITNHGYLDNPTFRGMRHHLLQTFDKIYVADLHGNMMKKEVSPDGSPDRNVFDIQPGVSIIIAVKTTPSPVGRSRLRATGAPLAAVRQLNVWGTREAKYNALWSEAIRAEHWTEIFPVKPDFMLVPRDATLSAAYDAGFAITALMPMRSVGSVSGKDGVNISFEREESEAKIAFLKSHDDAEIRARFSLPSKDARDWTVATAKQDALDFSSPASFVTLAYRPFDSRFTCYTGNSRGLYASPQRAVLSHYVRGRNLGLIIGRQGHVVGSMDWNLVFAVSDVSDFNLFYRGGGVSFPVYLYPAPGSFDVGRRVNFDAKIYDVICAKAGLTGADGDEIRVFDYIYGVLHSSDYRRTYAQFLKIDFPHIPYPASPEVFAHVAEKGGELRRLHLMEEAAIGATPYPFRGDGAGVIEKLAYQDGNVFISSRQWFEDVPEIAWSFHIGGYQPAQKWLKDRKGRTLSFDDVRHYQRIVKILTETDRIMNEIELPLA